MRTVTIIALLSLTLGSTQVVAQVSDPTTLAAIGDVSTKDARKAFRKSIPKSPKPKHCKAAEWEKFGFRHGFFEFHTLKKLEVTLAKRLAKMKDVCGESFDVARYKAGLAVGTDMRCGYERGLVDGEYEGRDSSITCDLDEHSSYAIGYAAGNAYEFGETALGKRLAKRQNAVARHIAFKDELKMTPKPSPSMVRREFALSDAADLAIRRHEAAKDYLRYLETDYHIDTSGWLRYKPNINLDYTVPTSRPKPLP